MKTPQAQTIQAWLLGRLSSVIGEEVESIDIKAPFADLGLSSLQLTELAGDLGTWLGTSLSPTLLLDCPSIERVCRHLSGPTGDEPLTPAKPTLAAGEAIAIVGLACRFPGARTPEELWTLLCGDKEVITPIPEERWEMIPGGAHRPWRQRHPRIYFGGFVDGVDVFDAAAFGIAPAEAERMDPQQRILMEVAWEALDDAGLTPDQLVGSATSVFVGISGNEYGLLQNSDPSLVDPQTGTGNSASIAANRLSYFFDLRGPSVAVDTACSSGLVAVHLACQSLRVGDCDLALVGAVNLLLNPVSTVGFEQGGMLAADGRCKAFAASADGYVRSEGAGVLVLKPLSRAVADNDDIYALILGSAVNQDGRTNGLTAPSRYAQQDVLRAAYRNAGVAAGDVQYVEAHGSGTPLGDPIEVGALGAVLAEGRPAGSRCGIGSVKSVIGHLEAAAGIAGMIKVALSLRHEALPPTRHVTEANPRISIERLPLRVQDTLEPWGEADGRRRIAGVTAIGFGGTNAHVVLSGAPARAAHGVSGGPRPWKLLTLSAHSEAALDRMALRLADHLRTEPHLDLDDLSYTLRHRRGAYRYRRAIVCRDGASARTLLERPRRTRGRANLSRQAPLPAFMFGGFGRQVPGAARDLYESEPIFRKELHRCCDVLARFGREAVLPVLVGGADPRDMADGGVSSVEPALFALEYSLAGLMIEWGIRPGALIGYGVGEYVAACLAGVFSLDDALFLVARRAELYSAIPPSQSVQVAITPELLLPLLAGDVAIAATMPDSCVVSGSIDAIAALEERLKQERVAGRRLAAAGWQSPTMRSLVEPLKEIVQRVRLNGPVIPYVSGASGTWARAEEATDPMHWARQLCQPVDVGALVRVLCSQHEPFLVEFGPQGAPCASTEGHPVFGGVPSTRHACLPSRDAAPGRDVEAVLEVVGRLWTERVDVDWAAFDAGDTRRLAPLPAYPFEQTRYWFAPPPKGTDTNRPGCNPERAPIAEWLYVPTWTPVPLDSSIPREHELPTAPLIVFVDALGVGERLAEHARRRGRRVVVVAAGDGFASSRDFYTVNPDAAIDYHKLVRSLRAEGCFPAAIVHLFSLTGEDADFGSVRAFALSQQLGFYSLLYLAQAVTASGVRESTHITVVANELHAIAADDRPRASKATIFGATKVIPQEHVGITCSCLEIRLAEGQVAEVDRVVEQIIGEVGAKSVEPVVAYRGDRRLAQTVSPLPSSASAVVPSRLRQEGVYLITGGVGRLGLIIAEYLHHAVRARLVLTCRRELPPREAWDAWIHDHPGQDAAADVIRCVKALETRGADILLLTADVSDRAAMARVGAETINRFGRLDGIIHAAGVLEADAFVPVSNLQPNDCERHFKAKCHGVFILDEMALKHDVDFVVLLSSVSALVGGIGFAPYAAANSFMDAFAHAKHADGDKRWCSVNLETWLTGSDAGRKDPGASVVRLAMSRDEGIEAFRRMLSTESIPQVAMSVGNLTQRILDWVGQEKTPPALPELSQRRRTPPTTGANDTNDVERCVAAVWTRSLGVATVGIDDNFFELGGNSLIGLKVIRDLHRETGVMMPTVVLFEYPTVRTLAQHVAGLRDEARPQVPADAIDRAPNGEERDIAIVAMSGRFPGAPDVEHLWKNLVDGIESVSFFTDQEMLEGGIDPESVASPSYVKARPVVTGADLFDANFFGFSPREAELTDPQQRLFLECAWEAMERAGYDAEQFAGRVGVFAGSSLSTYLLGLLAMPDIARGLSLSQTMAGNDKDSLTTSASYRLNLCGPSVAVQTHCSTSLVAVHLACQSLLAHECHLALAGGVSVRAPQKVGYHHQPGGQDSPDGHTRPFDRAARGTVFGDGVGIVVLKRLRDALADGDSICAIIKGSAINNDGALKVGFAAPSVNGQAEAVTMAFAKAGIDPRTVQYVEAHGSATELGDPIEMRALTKAFRRATPDRQFCAIGSAKANVGHLDKAAGVTGLIKAALTLRHQVIPAAINFDESNPEIDFAGSPFYVPRRTEKLQRYGGTPLRASVNSLGMGGTNAHLVLEEAPPLPPSGPSRPWQLLLISAKTAAALDTATTNLAEFLRANTESALADVAFTLRVGRRRFRHRRAVVCRDHVDAIGALDSHDPHRVRSLSQEAKSCLVTFLFPGVGEQYAGMARELYESEAGFRASVDECLEIVGRVGGVDVRAALLGEAGGGRRVADVRRLFERGGAATADGATLPPSIAQPATFIVEYGLAQLLRSWGVRPQAMLGYSLGEYVAACLAGVWSLEEALRIVTWRAAAIERLPGGVMLAIPLSAAEVRPLLGAAVAVAIANGPRLTVVAGPAAAVAALETRLAAQDIVSRRLATTHALHSPMMEPARAAFEQFVATVPGRAPQVPFISNVTGTWITAAEATAPAYWGRHLCEAVQFGAGVDTLRQETDRVFVEVGPGQSLTSWLKQQPDLDPRAVQAVSTLPSAVDNRTAQETVLVGLGQLWLMGVDVDWTAFHAGERRRRILLPTYPFERARYWVQPVPAMTAPPVENESKASVDDWCYTSAWTPSQRVPRDDRQPSSTDKAAWIVFGTDSALPSALLRRLRAEGYPVTCVQPGSDFRRHTDGTVTIDAAEPAHYRELLQPFRHVPVRIAHLWSVDPVDASTRISSLEQNLGRGFFSLVHLARGLGESLPGQKVDLFVVSNRMQRVTATERPLPDHATLIGPCRVVPLEYEHVTCRSVDLDLHDAAGADAERMADQLLQEFSSRSEEQFVAYRDDVRWVQRFAHLRGEDGVQSSVQLRDRGVYLITGGIGGIGLAMADYLARTVRAKLVLVGRSGLPPREEWPRSRPGGRAHQRIQQIEALEAAGAEVMIAVADVTDAARMRQVVDEAIGRFGALHGVIHAAGVPGNGLIQFKTAATAASVLAPKVHGTLVLESVLQDIPLDFLALWSSISAVTGGGPGQIDYCAANAFLDAYASANRATYGRLVSINWCEWQWDAWQEGLEGFPPDLQARFRRHRQQYGLTFEEGANVFRRALNGPQSQVIVCTRDLDTVLEESRSLTTAEIGRLYRRGGAALAAHPRPALEITYAPAASRSESQIAAIWQDMLGIETVGVYDNFFDLGGNSLIGLQVTAEMKKVLNVDLSPVALYEAPTVSALARHLQAALNPTPSTPPSIAPRRPRPSEGASQHGIAIVGMAGRFPGASGIEPLWSNLAGGIESITFFSDEELCAAGVEPSALERANYVKAGAVLEDIDRFDAGLFGYSPREAEVMDPQHRLFLECSWEALENAGYDPDRYDGSIGVYAGANISTYLLGIHGDAETFAPYNTMMIGVAYNSSDSLTTKASYKLNLRGPSVAVQTFCSTSAVAIHMACKSVLGGDCDMALAGGVRIAVPHRVGYHFEVGGIDSPDGHCRAFDARGQGSILGNGVAVVLLKRVEDAIRDGDHIYAVIKGSAINNDGSGKVGYTAPSVDAQTQVIAAALTNANVSADEIGYVEAHGTGTEMGDPIEILALSRAFAGTAKASCPIGSVKTNVGHLDRAAGAVSLIKTALMLERGWLPPSLHYETPNPRIDFAGSPFYVNTTLRAWPRGAQPRRAGVNALGVGGTNVHLVVEEAPAAAPSGPSRRYQVVVWSARTAGALTQATANLAGYLAGPAAAPLADAAYTLQVGRRVLGHRGAVVCGDAADAAQVLAGTAPARLLTRAEVRRQRPVVFLFAGVGEQYPGATADLYAHEPVFRAAVEACSAVVARQQGVDLPAVLYATAGAAGAVAPAVADTAVFVLDYALTQLLRAWGIRPQAVLGAGVGECVAACVAGVFALEDALRLVAARAQGPTAVSAVVATLPRQGPTVPWVSSVTGTWITAAEATDPAYWARSAEAPEAVSASVAIVLEAPETVLLEVGPSQQWQRRVTAHPACDAGRVAEVLTTVRPADAPSADDAWLLTTLAQLWLCGVAIDWAGFAGGEARRRVRLPTYPFERQRYWIEPTRRAPGAPARAPAALTRTPDMADWFYVPGWKQVPWAGPPRPADVRTPRCWLVFVAEDAVLAPVAQRLAAAEPVITVRPGALFLREHDAAYVLDPHEPTHFALLLQELATQGRVPTDVVYGWALAAADDAPARLAVDFYAVLALAQALGDRSGPAVALTLVSRGVHRVTGDEVVLPVGATGLGPCRVIPQEYPTVTCRQVDVGPPPAGAVPAATLCAQLVADLRTAGLEPVVAYRGGQRWVPTYEPVRLPAGDGRLPLVRAGGVYLITGGFGGIGLALAAHVARSAAGVTVVLLGRTGLPPRAEWPALLAGPASRGQAQVRQVEAVEALGAVVVPVAADVADLPQMRAVLADIHAHHGRLDGVIHAAGVPGAGLIQLKTPAAAAAVLAPKVAGTLVLDTLLRDEPLDFLVLISSLTSIVGGGPGQVDYCAANAVLDAYAQAAQRPDRRVVAINWGEWHWDAWQDGLLGFNPTIAAYFRETRRQFGISFDEGMEALDRILATPFATVVVSTREFNVFRELCKDFTISGILRESAKYAPKQSAHPRPALGTTYVVPRTDLELSIAKLWQDLLRLEEIGVHDNFFELGGNSLLGIQLISQMKKTLNREMAMYTLYEAPTVGALARLLDPTAEGDTGLEARRARGELRSQLPRRRRSAASIA